MIALFIACLAHQAWATFVPTTQFTATVIDAKTQKPIDRFYTVMKPMRGGGASLWQQHTLTFESKGRFSISLKKVWPGGAVVRVWAEGYKVSEVRVGPDSEPTGEVWLKPAQNLRAKVVDAAGKPVAKAEVVLASSFTRVSLANGHLQVSGIAKQVLQTPVQSADDGVFELPVVEDVGLVAVAHDHGFAMMKLSEVGETITLKAWSHIEGRLLLGNKPGAGWTVSFGWGAPSDAGEHWVSQWSTLTCDTDGKFASGPMIPDASVQAGVEVKTKQRSALVVGVATRVQTKAGQTLKLTLGGEGRPVVGRLVDASGKPLLNRKLWIRPPAPHFGFPEDEEVWSAQAAFFKAVQGVSYSHQVLTDAKGEFRISRLPQGEYEIDGARLDHKQRNLKIQPMDGGKSDEPLDLGDLKEP